MRFINLLQPLLDDMGINLRGGNIRVAQHELDGTEVRAALKQMRGKTVPQHVWSKRHAKTSKPSIGREYLPDADAAQRRAPAIYEQRRIAGDFAEQLRPGAPEILFHDGQRLFPAGDHPSLITFPHTPPPPTLRFTFHTAHPN